MTQFSKVNFENHLKIILSSTMNCQQESSHVLNDVDKEPNCPNGFNLQNQVVQHELRIPKRKIKIARQAGKNSKTNPIMRS